MLIIRRGSTPRITCRVPEPIDMESILNIWIYLYQRGDVIVDKLYNDVEKDYENRTLAVTLTQEESLALKEGVANLQVRLYFESGASMPSQEVQVRVLGVGKGGVMTSES